MYEWTISIWAKAPHHLSTSTCKWKLEWDCLHSHWPSWNGRLRSVRTRSNWKSHSLPWERKMVKPSKQLTFFQSKHAPNLYPVIPLLGVTKEEETCIHKKISTKRGIAISFIRAPKLETARMFIDSRRGTEAACAHCNIPQQWKGLNCWHSQCHGKCQKHAQQWQDTNKYLFYDSIRLEFCNRQN